MVVFLAFLKIILSSTKYLLFQKENMTIPILKKLISSTTNSTILANSSSEFYNENIINS